MITTKNKFDYRGFGDFIETTEFEPKNKNKNITFNIEDFKNHENLGKKLKIEKINYNTSYHKSITYIAKYKQYMFKFKTSIQGEQLEIFIGFKQLDKFEINDIVNDLNKNKISSFFAENMRDFNGRIIDKKTLEELKNNADRTETIDNVKINIYDKYNNHYIVYCK